MKYIDEVPLQNKRILLRVDFNVSLNPKHHIIDDARIKHGLPTIEHLLKQHNQLILISHLGRPQGHDASLSLAPVARRLSEYLPGKTVRVVADFTAQKEKIMRKDPSNELLLLENIRFYAGEETNDSEFAQELASLGDVYVNDAFSVSHRESATIVGLPALLPSYGGLQLKKEVETIGKAIAHPRKPLVAILGGKKISSKIKLIEKLITVADYVLLGGGLANTFFLAQGIEVGQSLVEHSEVNQAKHLLTLAKHKKTKLILPSDVIVGSQDGSSSTVKALDQMRTADAIYDIGPHTQAVFGAIIAQACTIIWNGPVGYFEEDAYRRGTDFIYYAIGHHRDAVSIVGGGETLAALSKKEHLERITHISTGGGAMLEFIENGTLPGIEALKHSPHTS